MSSTEVRACFTSAGMNAPGGRGARADLLFRANKCRENAVSATPPLKHFGWGRQGEGLSAEEEAFVTARAEARFGTKLRESASAPALDEIKLHEPRVKAPASLPFATSDHYDRAAHTHGKGYQDLARALTRDYADAPDVVAYPRDESEVAAVLDWGGGADGTATPYRGGSGGGR